MEATLDNFLEPSHVGGLPQAEPFFSTVHVVAFDLDCTLVDILRVKERAAEAAAWALADAGLDVNPHTASLEILQTALDVGIDRDDVVQVYLKRKVGAPDGKFIEIGQHAYERAEDHNAIPYPRVHKTLLELHRRGYTLALITDAPRYRAVRRLQAARLLHFFHEIVTLEDTPQGKADTSPYQVAAERLGAEPEEILMVGDNPERDVRQARALGCRTALAAYGLQPHFASEKPEHQADRDLQWVDDLLHILPSRT